LNVIKKLQKPN